MLHKGNPASCRCALLDGKNGHGAAYIIRKKAFSLSTPFRAEIVRVGTPHPQATAHDGEHFTAWIFSAFVVPRDYGRKQIHDMLEAFNHTYVAPESAPSPFVLPLFSAFSGLPLDSGLVAEALKDCSKSAMMSSMCSVPTEMRMRSSVTPLSIRSCSFSCSWVVVHGWMARVLESPTLWEDHRQHRILSPRKPTYFAKFEMSLKLSTT